MVWAGGRNATVIAWAAAISSPAALDLADGLAELEVHSADDLVINGVPDPLTSARAVRGRVRLKETGLDHRLERFGDGWRRQLEGDRDLSSRRGSMLSEVADDAGSDEVAESLDGRSPPSKAS
jgi:hypothetical protein